MALKKLAPKKLTKQLKSEAEANTTVSKKRGREEPQVLKEGNPLDHQVKRDQKEERIQIGLSKGITQNMGDFNSLRVDCWISNHIDSLDEYSTVMEELSGIIEERLEIEIEKVTD